MRTRLRAVPALAMTATLLAVAPVAAPAQASAPAPAAPVVAETVNCEVDYVLAGQWPGGFVAYVTVTNTGSVTVHHWRVTIVYPDGQVVVLEPASWNTVIPPGASVSAGFVGTGVGVPVSVDVVCTVTAVSPHL